MKCKSFRHWRHESCKTKRTLWRLTGDTVCTWHRFPRAHLILRGISIRRLHSMVIPEKVTAAWGHNEAANHNGILQEVPPSTDKTGHPASSLCLIFKICSKGFVSLPRYSDGMEKHCSVPTSKWPSIKFPTWPRVDLSCWHTGYYLRWNLCSLGCISAHATAKQARSQTCMWWGKAAREIWANIKKAGTRRSPNFSLNWAVESLQISVSNAQHLI